MTADQCAGPVPTSRAASAAAPRSAELLAALRDPTSYPEPTGAITLRETHMSWVFLTDRFVYKLKKPVRLNSLDYTTLERRHACCVAELALNRRLAPEVYLAVVPLTRCPAGRLRIGGDGAAVEWLVKMRRLAEARLLDVALADGTATAEDVERAATRLAAFFRAAPAERLAPDRHLGRFAHDLALDRALLCDRGFDLAAQAPDRLLDRLEAWLAARGEVLRARLQGGQVIEGHGDLRPEHIFLGPPVAVIDGLEFDRALRLLDPAEEVAFLALECDRLGAPWAGAIFRARCSTARGPAPGEELAAFYTAFRAALRARLCVGHLTGAEPHAPELWLAKARRYLATAWAAARSLTHRAGR